MESAVIMKRQNTQMNICVIQHILTLSNISEN